MQQAELGQENAIKRETGAQEHSQNRQKSEKKHLPSAGRKTKTAAGRKCITSTGKQCGHKTRPFSRAGTSFRPNSSHLFGLAAVSEGSRSLMGSCRYLWLAAAFPEVNGGYFRKRFGPRGGGVEERNNKLQKKCDWLAGGSGLQGSAGDRPRRRKRGLGQRWCGRRRTARVGRGAAEVEGRR